MGWLSQLLNVVSHVILGLTKAAVDWGSNKRERTAPPFPSSSPLASPSLTTLPPLPTIPFPSVRMLSHWITTQYKNGEEITIAMRKVGVLLQLVFEIGWWESLRLLTTKWLVVSMSMWCTMSEMYVPFLFYVCLTCFLILPSLVQSVRLLHPFCHQGRVSKCSEADCLVSWTGSGW